MFTKNSIDKEFWNKGTDIGALWNMLWDKTSFDMNYVYFHVIKR